MKRQALAEKIIVLGVDGFDPSLAKKFMNEGRMPALEQFTKRGASAQDMVLLGNMPTVTPPMWTTLATGATPRTHGITGFFNPHPDPEKMEYLAYALDSRSCRAEQIWNVFAEAGKKTLVWHWPGSSWPPTSSSDNLHVVDGTQPAAVNFGVGIIDWEKMCIASTDVAEVRFTGHDAAQAGAGCVLTGLDNNVADEDAITSGADVMGAINFIGAEDELFIMSMTREENELNVLGHVSIDQSDSPITAPKGWANAPEGAKEFTIVTSAGVTRRPCLILPNEAGIYDRVAVYQSKKADKPLVVLTKDVYTPNIIDEINDNGEIKLGHRCLKLLDLGEKGNYVRLWMSMAIDIKQDSVFHPKALLDEVQSHCGYVPAISQITGSNTEFVQRIMLPSWDHYSQWQADCLTRFMDNADYEMIISHLHNIDLIAHQIWHFAKHKDKWNNDEKLYQSFMAYTYEQTDKYLARFLPYLDKGWTVIITSDHGLITEDNDAPGLGEGGVMLPVMEELGYTVAKVNAAGEKIREIDWTKTKAIAIRAGHIYLNLKGRTSHGIVEPEDKYALEAQIISDLYQYRDPETNQRVVALALRNKDAVVLGVGGDRGGDILYFVEEGYNIIHADSLSTQKGYFDTSVSPIFVAAGQGIKENFVTERVIRQVDVAPTLAALGGVRMPAQCEGAPVYQILAEEF